MENYESDYSKHLKSFQKDKEGRYAGDLKDKAETPLIAKRRRSGRPTSIPSVQATDTQGQTHDMIMTTKGYSPLQPIDALAQEVAETGSALPKSLKRANSQMHAITRSVVEKAKSSSKPKENH